MSGRYILDSDGTPRREANPRAWAWWFERSDVARIVALTPLRGGGRVSTVFLGLDHGFGSGPPVLWETLVFDAPDGEDHQRRYTSREDALAGHAEIVAELGGAA